MYDTNTKKSSFAALILFGVAVLAAIFILALNDARNPNTIPTQLDRMEQHLLRIDARIQTIRNHLMMADTGAQDGPWYCDNQGKCEKVDMDCLMEKANN